MRHDLPADQWRKSSYSNGGSGNCVEIQATDDALLAVGDSKDRARGAFTFPTTAWTAFVGLIASE
jgi:hypothetical protein